MLNIYNGSVFTGKTYIGMVHDMSHDADGYVNIYILHKGKIEHRVIHSSLIDVIDDHTAHVNRYHKHLMKKAG